MTDALIAAYKRNFNPVDGTLHSGAHHTENGTKLQLSLLRDARFKESVRPVFHATVFRGAESTASEMVNLKDNELAGWLKARFPKLDWRQGMRQELIAYMKRLR